MMMRISSIAVVLLLQPWVFSANAQNPPKAWSTGGCSSDIMGRKFACTTFSKSGPQWCKDIKVGSGFSLTNIELGQGWVICDYVHSDPGPPHGARQWGAIHTGTNAKACPSDSEFDSGLQRCISHEDPARRCTIGNPIVLTDGIKVQEEIDARIAYGEFTIPIIRYYNSETAIAGVDQSAPQQSWEFSFRDKLESILVKTNIGGSITYENEVVWTRPNSEKKTFVGSSPDHLTSTDPSIISITPLVAGSRTSGWSIKDRNGDVYVFNNVGFLTRFEKQGEYIIHFTYQNSNTEVIAKIDGAEVFRYIRDLNEKIITLKSQPNTLYGYAYDSRMNMTSVTYPGATTKTYHYENASFPRALTGITDQSGNRYVTWTYDANGKAISSEGMNGRHKYSLDLQFESDPDDPRVISTNPLGKLTTYHLLRGKGGRKITKVDGHASENCASAYQYKTYNPRGYLETETDWKGNVRYYAYDSDGRIIGITDGMRWEGEMPQWGQTQALYTNGVEVQRILYDLTTDEAVSRTRICWDSATGLKKGVVSEFNVTTFTYDTSGRKTGHVSKSRTALGASCD